MFRVGINITTKAQHNDFNNICFNALRFILFPLNEILEKAFARDHELVNEPSAAPKSNLIL